MKCAIQLQIPLQQIAKETIKLNEDVKLGKKIDRDLSQLGRMLLQWHLCTPPGL